MKKLLLSLSIVFISMSGWAQCNADFSDSLSTWTSNPYDVFYSNTSTGYSSWSTTFYWTFSGGASPSSSYTMDTVSVTYPGPGTYTACIFMVDSITPCIDSICHSIVVSSQCNSEHNSEFNSYFTAVQPAVDSQSHCALNVKTTTVG